MDIPLELKILNNEMMKFIFKHEKEGKKCTCNLDLDMVVKIYGDEEQQQIEIEQELETIEPGQIYVSGQCIGSGYFSQVFIGTHNNIQVACKRYPMKGDTFYNETANLKLLAPHQSFPTLHGILKLGIFYYIIMELVNGITLENYLNTNPNPVELFSVLRKIVKALVYMHSIGVTHANISTSNILVYRFGNKCRIKFVDFAFSRNNDPHEEIKCKGKIEYIAPELRDKSQTRADLNEKTDVYSFSVVLKKILASNILRDNFLRIDWFSIYSNCSDASQSKRPTFEEILKCLS
ncbi:hypothetical protein DICPUDRAFT_160477 [Dictyostelium purpureum]|uniref:Protein kinase domain-containing protein n=1 Tax=Dictyostelium purpureum TaxID=5786 RepID=F1A6D6_DICPU|nr:uncharacterized protein DICPUDRAFT_160477 [Dictyostelium purpureum]EGC28243.1 hypothetical protein DICPUDRAFT_160477 [Dictyostelium purpureum]|eukprot:XP_003295230.1 hypothetical protein DICPUDRAFT_160477 [Dictyostelium purpureum]